MSLELHIISPSSKNHVTGTPNFRRTDALMLALFASCSPYPRHLGWVFGMLSSAREKLRQHWEDPLLLRVVNDDLLGKESWSNLRPVLLELSPCQKCGHGSGETASSCQQRLNDDRTWTSRKHNRCSCNTAHGIAATLVEDVEGGCSPSTAASTTAAVVVFAVNAGCALPTRRFCDVVSAAEEHLRLHDQRGLESGVRQRSRVLAAFCDGSSVIYYTASSGINTS